MNYNYKVMKEFIKYCERGGLGERRIQKYINLFKRLNKLGINLKNLDRNEIDKFYFYLRKCDYKDSTRLGIWKLFKKVCRFVNPEIDLSEWKFKKPKTQPDILTKEEIFTLISNARSIRDKLIIFLLYESGMRIGELLNLRKDNIRFDEYGAILKINGKTGVRTIRVVRCTELLKSYVQFSFSNKLFVESEVGIRKMLQRVAKRCGIKKRIYPHLFRHTRATHLSKYLTDREMCLYFGWAKDSKMPSVYSHLSMRDIDERIIEVSKIEQFLIQKPHLNSHDQYLKIGGI